MRTSANCTLKNLSTSVAVMFPRKTPKIPELAAYVDSIARPMQKIYSNVESSMFLNVNEGLIVHTKQMNIIQSSDFNGCLLLLRA